MAIAIAAMQNSPTKANRRPPNVVFPVHVEENQKEQQQSVIKEMQAVIRTELRRFLQVQQSAASQALESLGAVDTSGPSGRIAHSRNPLSRHQNSHNSPRRKLQNWKQGVPQTDIDEGTTPVGSTRGGNIFSARFTEDITDVTVTELHSDDRFSDIEIQGDPSQLMERQAQRRHHSEYNPHHSEHSHRTNHDAGSNHLVSDKTNGVLSNGYSPEEISHSARKLKTIPFPLLQLDERYYRDREESRLQCDQKPFSLPQLHNLPLLSTEPVQPKLTNALPETTRLPVTEQSVHHALPYQLPSPEKVLAYFHQNHMQEMLHEPLPLLQAHWSRTFISPRQGVSLHEGSVHSPVHIKETTELYNKSDSINKPPTKSNNVAPRDPITPEPKETKKLFVDRETVVHRDVGCQHDYLSEDEDSFHYHPGFAIFRDKTSQNVFIDTAAGTTPRFTPSQGTMTAKVTQKSTSAQTIEFVAPEGPNDDDVSSHGHVGLRLSKAPILDPHLLKKLRLDSKKNQFLSVVSIDDEMWRDLAGNNIPSLDDQPHLIRPTQAQTSDITPVVGADPTTMKKLLSYGDRNRGDPLVVTKDVHISGRRTQVKEDVVRTLKEMDLRMAEINDLSKKMENDFSTSRSLLKTVSQTLAAEVPERSATPRNELEKPSRTSKVKEVRPDKFSDPTNYDNIATNIPVVLKSQLLRKDEEMEDQLNYPPLQSMLDSEVSEKETHSWSESKQVYVESVSQQITPRGRYNTEEVNANSVPPVGRELRRSSELEEKTLRNEYSESNIPKKDDNFLLREDFHEMLYDLDDISSLGGFELTSGRRNNHDHKPGYGKYDPESLHQWTMAKRNERLQQYKKQRNEMEKSQKRPLFTKADINRCNSAHAIGDQYTFGMDKPQSTAIASSNQKYIGGSLTNLSTARSRTRDQKVPANIRMTEERERLRLERMADYHETRKMQVRKLVNETIHDSGIPPQNYESVPVRVNTSRSTNVMMQTALRDSQRRQKQQQQQPQKKMSHSTAYENQPSGRSTINDMNEFDFQFIEEDSLVFSPRKNNNPTDRSGDEFGRYEDYNNYLDHVIAQSNRHGGQPFQAHVLNKTNQRDSKRPVKPSSDETSLISDWSVPSSVRRILSGSKTSGTQKRGSPSYPGGSQISKYSDVSGYDDLSSTQNGSILSYIDWDQVKQLMNT